MAADAGPVVKGFVKVEQSQKRVEQNMGRIAQKSRESADETVKGLKETGEAADEAGNKLEDMFGKFGLALGVGAAAAAAKQIIGQAVEEAKEIAEGGFERERSVAQIALGAGEQGRIPYISGEIERQAGALGVTREVAEAGYAGIRDALPSDRFLGTEGAMTLNEAILGTYGRAYADKPGLVQQQAEFTGNLYKFFQASGADVGASGFNDQLISFSMRLQQEAGSTNVNSMLQQLNMSGAIGSGDPVADAAMMASINQEASLLNMRPQFLNRAISYMPTLAGEFPELEAAMESGGTAGGLRYTLGDGGAELMGRVFGEENFGRALALRNRIDSIDSQAAMYRGVYGDAGYARRVAGEYMAAAPNSVEEMAQRSRQDLVFADQEAQEMRRELQYRGAALYAQENLGMPAFMGEDVTTGLRWADKWWRYNQMFLAPGANNSHFVFSMEDGIDAQNSSD
jgi:hypothetical protein